MLKAGIEAPDWDLYIARYHAQNYEGTVENMRLPDNIYLDHTYINGKL